MPLLNINTGILIDDFKYDDEFKVLEATPLPESRKKYLTKTEEPVSVKSIVKFDQNKYKSKLIGP